MNRRIFGILWMSSADGCRTPVKALNAVSKTDIPALM